MVAADCRLYYTGSLVYFAAGEHVQDDVAWMRARPVVLNGAPVVLNRAAVVVNGAAVVLNGAAVVLNFS
jgi:hypothetical protein